MYSAVDRFGNTQLQARFWAHAYIEAPGNRLVTDALFGTALVAGTQLQRRRVGTAAILGAFGTGLLLTFTPCVLPMIPIVSTVVVGQGSSATKLRAGLLSTVYVLGTAVTYAAIGIVAGATGDQLQAYFQNVWAIGLLAAVLGAMALSLFGLYELQIPSFIQSRLQRRAQGVHTGSVAGGSYLGCYRHSSSAPACRRY